jgi:hypothetical protein
MPQRTRRGASRQTVRQIRVVYAYSILYTLNPMYSIVLCVLRYENVPVCDSELSALIRRSPSQRVRSLPYRNAGVQCFLHIKCHKNAPERASVLLCNKQAA